MPVKYIFYVGQPFRQFMRTPVPTVIIVSKCRAQIVKIMSFHYNVGFSYAQKELQQHLRLLGYFLIWIPKQLLDNLFRHYGI
jgi:hypothetical protein